MAQLRWILLGAGVALILGLWWWETRKAKARDAKNTGPARPGERAEPQLEQAGDQQASAAPETVSYAPTIERARVPRRPPVIEIPDDAEVDVSAYVGRDRRRIAEPEPAPAAQPPPAAKATPAAAAPAEPESVVEEEVQDDYHRAPWVRTHPLDRPQAAPKLEEEPVEAEPSDPIARHTAEAAKQRIVALRLVAPESGWNGKALRAALEGEDLRFGRYSIFHREREDGKTLFYVASLMEPGSFDLTRMDGREFPGISVFGIVPGPIEAPETFDLVLAVARRLAEKLGGQLQDEQGSTLTAQRILNLREELVHFEHRHKRLRRS